MTSMRWAKGATEFTVGITRNKQNNTRYSYIPKPVLEWLGNPKRLKFAIRDGQVIVERPDDESVPS